MIVRLFQPDRCVLPYQQCTGAAGTVLLNVEMASYWASSVLLCLNLAAAAQFEPNWASLSKKVVPSWYSGAKFGM